MLYNGVVLKYWIICKYRVKGVEGLGEGYTKVNDGLGMDMGLGDILKYLMICGNEWIVSIFVY